MRVWLPSGLILLLLGRALVAVPPDPMEPLHWTVAGERRKAIVLFPKAPRNKPAPLVFYFHGHGGRMENLARRMQIEKYWPEAAVVFTQGLPTPSRVDPMGKRAGWQSVAGTMGDRDLKFVDAVLRTVRQKHAIDEDRIYAGGMSNGAIFTYVLWSARPDIFAAYAPCAGILRSPDNLTLKPGAILHIAGESDRIAPFRLQEQSMAKVREVNGCKDTPVEWESLCKLYPAKSKSGAPFVSYIHPGGHSIPPQAVELMIKFFKEHPRNKSAIGALE